MEHVKVDMEAQAFLLMLLNAKDNSKMNGVQISHVKTSRNDNPQNTWEAQLLDTVILDIKQNPKLWNILYRELENIREGRSSVIENYFTTDANGAIQNRVILKKGEEIYYFPPENAQEYRLSKNPKYLAQSSAIEHLTGKDDVDILESAKKSYMADWLLNYLCEFYKESETQILSTKKTRNLVFLRSIYSYFMNKRLNYSLPQIGRRLGNRHHTSILQQVRKIDTMVEADADFKKMVEDLWEKANIGFVLYVQSTNKQLNS